MAPLKMNKTTRQYRVGEFCTDLNKAIVFKEK